MEHHVGFVVQDLEKMIHFYRDILGFSIVDNGIREGEKTASSLGLSHAKYRILRAVPPKSEFFLQLIYFEGEQEKPKKRSLTQIGYQHIGLEVESVEMVYARMKRHNITCVSAPIQLDSGVKLFYCYDPEQNILEFFQNPI